MRATGIPLYIALYQQHERTIEAVEKIPGAVSQGVTKVLEENGAGAGNITRSTLASTLRGLLSEAGVIGGSSRATADTDQSPSLPLTYHLCDDKFRVLPENFAFPSIDTLGAWWLWLFGNEARGYPPFRSISTTDLSTRDKRKT
jgi:hypothetical protein